MFQSLSVQWTVNLYLLSVTWSASAALAGTVRNERGDPLGNLTLSAFRGGYAITTAMADEHGNSRLLTFPRFVVFIEHEGYEPLATVISGEAAMLFDKIIESACIK